jgi:hypothetical protein
MISTNGKMDPIALRTIIETTATPFVLFFVSSAPLRLDLFVSTYPFACRANGPPLNFDFAAS